MISRKPHFSCERKFVSLQKLSNEFTKEKIVDFYSDIYILHFHILYSFSIIFVVCI
jgi:hypothetical protein